MSKNESNSRRPFVGFKEVYLKEFFIYPNILEQYWWQLSGSEQKCLDFILRQTIGFRKQKDRIAYSQFVSGIGERNKGTGLSLSQVKRAVKGLEQKGFIEVTRFKNHPSIFTLVFEKIETITVDPKAFEAFIKTIKL